jgi:hypothetical protein
VDSRNQLPRRDGTTEIREEGIDTSEAFFDNRQTQRERGNWFVDFLEKVFKKSDAIVFRRIGEECILVPIRQGVGDLESIYTLNETAARIWELLDGTAKGTEIRDKITEEFDVTPEEAEKDIVHHLKELAGIKAITEE